MKNKPFSLLPTARTAMLAIIIAAASVTVANSGTPAACAMADLAAGPVTVPSVNGNTFQYHFEVRNVGADTLFLNRMFFQTYVSQNGTYNAPYQAAGGSIFGPSAPALLPGQSYTAYWYYNPTTPADLSQYPYLIIDIGVVYGASMPECTLANNIISHYIGCTKAELSVGNIVISSVNGNTFQYTFDITNLGWDTLHLDRYFFQAYISQDATYDFSDQPAGGSIFPGAPVLAKDQTHTQYWYYNFTVPENITLYHYVIVQVLPMPGDPHPECNPGDNVAVKDIGCNLAELTVGNVIITSLDAGSNTFDYTFDVTNLGWDTLFLDRMFFQTYLSSDSVYSFDDPAAGGSIFGSSAPALTKDQSYTQSWYYSPSVPEDLSLYPYLLIQVMVYSGQMPECNTGNNSIHHLLPVEINDDPVVFEPVEGPFTISTTPKGCFLIESMKRVPFAYAIYSLNKGLSLGDKIASGSATEGITELCLNRLPPGLYVINLTTGRSSYSYKFMVRE